MEVGELFLVFVRVHVEAGVRRVDAMLKAVAVVEVLLTLVLVLKREHGGGCRCAVLVSTTT